MYGFEISLLICFDTYILIITLEVAVSAGGRVVDATTQNAVRSPMLITTSCRELKIASTIDQPPMSSVAGDKR